MLVSNIQFEELSSTNLFLNSLFEQNIKINNYVHIYIAINVTIITNCNSKFVLFCNFGWS